MTPQELYAAIQRNPANAYFRETGDDIAPYLAQVPVNLHCGLVAYALLGFKPGSFLCAVIANDLKNAALRADETSVNFLREIVRCVYGALPTHCHGDYGALREWVAIGGLAGRTDDAA